MLGATFTIAVLATIAFVVLSGLFLNSVKSEAPQLFESWGRPTVGQYLWRKKWLMPFSSMVLFGGYREKLSSYPKSRAMAGWVGLVHWIQLAALIVFFVGVIGVWAGYDF